MNTFSAPARVVADAEVRTAGSAQVCSVRLAVNSGFGDKKSTLWISASIWRGADRLAPLLVKGKEVVVTGELSMREWSKADGTKGQSLELNVDRLDLVGGRDQAAATHSQPAPGAAPQMADEIPF